ncbi:MAG: hypothetical protein WB495_28600 [Xanthobacteraceae bacterium]
MVGAAVDQKRLERREEHARRVADARHLLGVGPDGAAEFLQDQIIAGALLATQQIALELLDEHRPRLRRERPEILPQPFDGLSIARHSQITVLN